MTEMKPKQFTALVRPLMTLVANQKSTIFKHVDFEFATGNTGPSATVTFFCSEECKELPHGNTFIKLYPWYSEERIENVKRLIKKALSAQTIEEFLALHSLAGKI